MKKIILCMLLVLIKHIVAQQTDQISLGNTFPDIVNWKIIVMNNYKDPIKIHTQLKEITLQKDHSTTLTLGDISYAINSLNYITEPHRNNPRADILFTLSIDTITHNSILNPHQKIYFYYDKKNPDNIYVFEDNSQNKNIYNYKKGSTVKITMDLDFKPLFGRPLDTQNSVAH